MPEMKLNGELWVQIHKKAASSKTEFEKKDFANYMRNIYHQASCPICKGHLGRFMTEVPFTDFWNITEPLLNGEDVGMSKWSWTLHNDVNRRIGKPLMPWRQYLSIYHGKTQEFIPRQASYGRVGSPLRIKCDGDDCQKNSGLIQTLRGISSSRFEDVHPWATSRNTSKRYYS